MNKQMIVIPFFILALFSVPVSAQTGFHRSPAGKMGLGMGYQRYIPPKRTEAPFRFHAQTLLGKTPVESASDLGERQWTLKQEVRHKSKEHCRFFIGS